MKEQRRNEIKVGITVILGVIILFAGFSIFKEWTITGDITSVRIRFNNSAGLQVGDPVSINGVKAGKVLSVTMDRSGVIVSAEIQPPFTVTEDASATIQMLELMGGKQIGIIQTPDAAPMDLTKELRGHVDPDIAGALAMLGGMGGKVDSLTHKATALLDNTNALIGDAEMIGALKETVLNMRVISADMRTLVTANKDEISDIAATLQRLARRSDTLLAELRPRIDSGFNNVERIAVRADTLLGDVQALMGEIRDSRGLLHTVLHDTTLALRFNETLGKVDSVLQIIMDGKLRIKLRL